MSGYLWFKIIYSIFGTLMGLGIFFVFSLYYGNWNCAVSGLASGVYANFCVIVHLESNRNETTNRGTLFRVFRFIGVISQILSIALVIYYIVSAVSQNQSLTPYGNGYYLAAVWCIISWKWAFTLFIYSHIYMKKLNIYDRINNEQEQRYNSI